jgi:hypothetical protein
MAFVEIWNVSHNLKNVYNANHFPRTLNAENTFYQQLIFYASATKKSLKRMATKLSFSVMRNLYNCTKIALTKWMLHLPAGKEAHHEETQ